MKKTLFTLAALALLVAGFSISSCNKSEEMLAPNGGNAMNSSTSTDFKAALLSDNVAFEDETNNVFGYAWTWEIQRVVGQTGLSHFNFLDGILCSKDEEEGTLREHIVGAYYSQNGGSTWNYVAVSWGIDGSTKDICYNGEVFKINYGGDNIQIRLIMDSQYEVGVQYALYKRGKGSRGNSVPECGIIEFAAPSCEIVEDCWKGETAFGGATNPDTKGAWWFAFDANGPSTQPIYAGQKLVSGASVTLVNGQLVIDLGNDMKLDGTSASVKIQAYSELPASRPAAGLFTTYKGTDLAVSVPTANYYVIHLDVLVKKSNCED